jgi:predicted lactoylglutathione lyase
MESRITVVTLGVHDLERAVAFYKGLGFATEGIVGKDIEYGAVAFFDLQDGVKLAVWPYESIAHDTGLAVGIHNPVQLTLGHNVNNKEEVDAVMQKAEEAGAAIIKPSHDTAWGGYAGYFQDPDGHVWEVVWNPAISV